VGTSRI